MKRFVRLLILGLAAQLGLASLAPASAQELCALALLAAVPALSGPYDGTVLLALPSGVLRRDGRALLVLDVARLAQMVEEVRSGA